ncbi:tRNA (cytidine(56)-2'-O)-methyltransferase [Candidatus Micrarchaeota archaeon]|nr:tRNA (cytidine(56)-2'-O)-methyltransferase [Candidatus Micrarchaeota archaeon]
MKAIVLRLGHRKTRDARVTTHVCLAARAFGAERAVICGERDPKLLAGVNGVGKRWGGGFRAAVGGDWRRELKKAKRDGFTLVHLTMYGIPFEKRLAGLRKKRKLAIVVGGSKVPGEAYGLADHNLAVTNQPHSEVAALAVFLNALRLRPKFAGARLRILPKEHGKRVINRENNMGKSST